MTPPSKSTCEKFVDAVRYFHVGNLRAWDYLMDEFVKRSKETQLPFPFTFWGSTAFKSLTAKNRLFAVEMLVKIWDTDKQINVGKCCPI